MNDGFTGIELEDHLDESPPRDLDAVRRDAASGTLSAAFVWLGYVSLVCVMNLPSPSPTASHRHPSKFLLVWLGYTSFVSLVSLALLDLPPTQTLSAAFMLLGYTSFVLLINTLPKHQPST